MLSSFTLDDFSELHIIQDKAIDFYAAICLHRNGRGPAIGGCRFMEYPSFDEAIHDAIRLSKAMSYKAAISDLLHDGGKAVIMQPKHIKSREVLLNRFAECVESLGGKYITTIDSGTSQIDMSIIKNKTPFVIGYTNGHDEDNNPSTSTALGVYKGIKSAVKLKYGHDSLKNLHVAIQGVGSVGYLLARLLHEEGVCITVSDLKEHFAERCAKEFNANIVEPANIYSVNCDVFSPCALGRIINENTVSKLKAKIVAGAANDQLVSENIVNVLESMEILYIPDYLINAGGLIHLSLQMEGKNKNAIENEVSRIADRIFYLAELAKSRKETLFHVTQSSAQTIMKSKDSADGIESKNRK